MAAIGPANEAQRAGPTAKSGKEMALDVAGKVGRPNISDRSFVNVAGRDVAGFDEVAEPLGGIGVNLVVIRGGGHEGGSHQPERASFQRGSPCVR